MAIIAIPNKANKFSTRRCLIRALSFPFISRLKIANTGINPSIEKNKKSKRDTIIACDALTGKEKRRFKGHKNRVSDLVVTADNQRLISLDKGKGIAIWNMNTGTKIMNLHPSYDGARNLGADDIKSHKVHISPDGRRLAYQGGDGTTVWSTGKITEPSQDEVSH